MIYLPYFNSDTNINENFIMQNFHCNLYQKSEILEILVRKFNNKQIKFMLFKFRRNYK